MKGIVRDVMSMLVGDVRVDGDGKISGRLSAKYFTWNERQLEIGWIKDKYTWYYVSATSVKILTEENLSDVFSAGTKVRYKQGGAYKYAYVTGTIFGSDVMILILNAGTDYSVSNAAITDNYFSHAVPAPGFPDLFNWTPNYSDNTTMTFSSVTTNYARFRIKGKTLEYWVSFKGTTGGSTAAYLNFRLPRGIANAGYGGTGYVIDGGNPLGGFGTVITTSTGRIGVAKYDRSAWSLGADREVALYGSVEY